MLPRARRLQAHGFPPRHRTGVQRAYTRAELEAAGVAAAAAVTHQCRRPPCVGWGHARMPGRLPDSVRSHKHGLRPAVGPHAPPSCRCALLMLQPVCCYSPQLPTSCCSEARPGCSRRLRACARRHAILLRDGGGPGARPCLSCAGVGDTAQVTAAPASPATCRFASSLTPSHGMA